MIFNYINVLAFVVFLLFFSFVVYTRRVTYYSFSVEAHLLGYIVIFYLFPILFEYVYIPKQISDYGDVEIFFPYVIQYSLLVLMLFMIISLSRFEWFKKVKATNILPRSDKGLNVFICISFLAYYLFLMFFIFFKSDYSLIFSQFDQFAMKIRNGGAFFLNVLYTVEFLPMLYLVRSYRLSYKLISLYVLLAVMIYFLLGARTLVVSTVLGVTIVLMIRKSFNISKLLYPVLIMVAAFLLSSIIRTGMNLDTNKMLGYFSRNSDQLANSSVIYKGIHEETLDVKFGGTMVDALYYLVPSTILQDKPKSYYPSRLIYGEIAEETGRTFNFGLFGRSILDFGIYASILFIIFFLLLFKAIYQYLNKFNDSLKYLFLLWLYSHLFQIFILGFNSHFLAVALFNFFVCVLIYRLSSKFIKVF